MIKILYFITEDWYFWSHRLPIARAARDAGHEVIIVTRVNKHKERIESEGFRVIPIQLKRRGSNLFKELASLFEIIQIYYKEKPDIVHHVAVKPVLYGSVAGLITRVPSIVNAFAGLGYIFLNKGLKSSFVRRFFVLTYTLIFYSKSTVGLFQNPEDKAFFISAGIVGKKRTELIKGSGVDMSLFDITPEPTGVITILLAGRMLWDKGIGELVEASRRLHSKGVKCRIVLVGKPDTENPRSIPKDILQDWHGEGVIEWWGYQENMAEVLSKAHIVVLPSYREGVPKFLIEAAACGRPIVTTDVPGCREIVREGQNGFLVSAQDAKALADALEILIHNSDLRKRMGKRGRKIVAEEFSEEIVIVKTMALYEKLIGL
jgi:glycosyltransferase involved in cell wall biosynthesis